MIRKLASIGVLLLLSPLASGSEWPADLGFHKDLFVDGGANLTSRRSYAADYLGMTQDTLLTSSTSRTRSVIAGNPDDSNGALLYPDGQPRYRAIYVNGGSAPDHAYSLGKAGRDAIIQFILEGGSYTGSCAGAALISNRRQNVPLLRVWDGYMAANSVYRSGSMTVEFEPGEFRDLLASLGCDSVIAGIPYRNGPIFSESYRHPEGTEFVGTITKTSSSLWRNRGTPYLIVYEPTDDSGRIVIQPSHPEYARSGEHMLLMAAILLHAMEGTGIPDLKDVLSGGDQLWEVIGDQQYHRFIIDVPPGAPRLVIELASFGSVKAFLNYGDEAHEFAYLDTVESPGANSLVINDPDPGLWFLSVYGDHEVMNGVDYRIWVRRWSWPGEVINTN